jgi:two-component system response regulator DegU
MDNKKRVIIIEDEAIIRRAIKDAMQENGKFDVWEAEEGGKAFEIIQEFHPDLALVDIDIPNMDGITLAKELVAKKLNAKTKVMFLTNSNDLSTISDAMSINGVLGYFFKADWDIKDIVKEIEKKLIEQTKIDEEKEKK